MKKPILFAVVLGSLTALLVFAYITSVEKKYRKGSENVQVFVAKKYIDQGLILDKDILEKKLVPKEYIQPKAVQSLEDIINKAGNPMFMTIAPIEEGEQIVTTKLVMLGIQTGISSITPSKMRALTLTNIDSSVKMIKPGNRVDVLAILEYEDAGKGKQEVIVTLFQNVLVLAVGNKILGDTSAPKIRLGDKVSMPGLGEELSISIAVTPEQAEEIILASNKGLIKFVLRSLGDEVLYDSKGVTMRRLIENRVLGAVFSKDQISGEDKYIRKQQAEALKMLNKYGKKKH
ncbi:Flp pilus assembly protein CpaB [bacterium]